MQISDHKPISVLMVGRIYQEQEVFKLIELTAYIFVNSCKASFYFNDFKTYQKMSRKHPQYTSRQFKIKEHENIIDYIITIGGDGTILYAAKDFINKVPPLVSFQRGSLGFMCRFPLSMIKTVIQNIAQSHLGQKQLLFQRSQLIRLKATKSNLRQSRLGSSVKVCINEVYISRKAQERITIEIVVNNQHLTYTAGDGILISTPTGSTAYSLSAGGPLLQNGVNGILIVPIAPNSLSFRPICFPSDCEIKIKLHKSSRSTAMVSFDGQTTQEFDFDQQIAIKKAEHNIVFLEQKQSEMSMPTWIQRLKFFLGWNEKYRTPEQYIPQINTHTNKKECIEDD